MTDPYVEHDPASAPRVASAKGLATLVYALQAASVITGVTLLVAVIINYVKMDDVRGTWVESHFRWQIRTFWYLLLCGVLLGVAILVLVGGAAAAGAGGREAGAAGAAVSAGVVAIAGGVALCAWFVYRVVRGWLRLSENRPVF